MRTVYFIQRGEAGPIKIGSTKGDPVERMKTLQTCSPEKLRFLGCFQAKETWIQRRFQWHRISGEWFQPHQEILDFIKTRTTTATPKERRSGSNSRSRCEIGEKGNGIQIACSVPRSVYSGMLEWQDEIKRLTGIKPSISAVVRAMLNEATADALGEPVEQ